MGKGVGVAVVAIIVRIGRSNAGGFFRTQANTKGGACLHALHADDGEPAAGPTLHSVRAGARACGVWRWTVLHGDRDASHPAIRFQLAMWKRKFVCRLRARVRARGAYQTSQRACVVGGLKGRAHRQGVFF